MGKEVYYVIQCSEDGEVSFFSYSKEELQKLFAEGEINPEDACSPAGVHDLASGEAQLIIVRGEIVIPKAKAKVTKWEI